jgi:Ribosomal protein L3
MGHRKKSAARRGSLGFYPRQRAEEFVPRIKSWPVLSIQETKLLGFIGYKVGMTHVFMVENRQGLPTYGKEVMKPVTVVEVPPVYVLAVRGYAFDVNKGLYPLTEAWGKVPDNLELERRLKTLGSFDNEGSIKELQSSLNELKEIRVLIASQPKLTGGLSKKKPDVIEVKVNTPSNDMKKALDYALGKLGQQVSIKEVFQTRTSS